ncbi:MAG TPA: GvpL/GvpF family gas vesicle protein [Vicinamibacterales bacterium]|nr:GvpL/GvpF family gas vesicle protein [Vicinamibacterales bacterium]
MTLTYVYCLVRSARAPSLRAVPPPLPGGDRVRLLDAGGGLWAVVTHLPQRSYGEASLAGGLKDLDWVARRALAHEAVVEHFLRAPAVLPMKLFTLFNSDERALAHLANDRRHIDRVLTRLERQLELGLRLTLDERFKIAAKASQKTAGESGAAYLARKRDQIEGHREQLARARRDANRVYRTMAREATAARRRTETEQTSGSTLLVDAAFLVPAARMRAFRAALRRQHRQLGASGVRMALTGPWPPYHFVGREVRRS